MADYHSLLARAVANLPKPSTPAARKAIYDRARSALINQLRSLKPPLPDSDIAREEAALDEAIGRLEAENAPPPPAAPTRPIMPPPKPSSPPAPPAPARDVAAPKPLAPSTPVRAPALSPSPTRVQNPIAPAANRPPPGPGPSRSVSAPSPSRAPLAVPAEATQLVVASGVPNAAPRVSPIVAPPARNNAPVRQAAEPSQTLVAPDVADAARPDNAPKIGSPVDTETRPGGAARVAPEPPRPIAPPAHTARRASPWLWVGFAVAVGLIGSVAVAAFLLREKPQDLTIKDPTATSAAAGSAANGEKIAQRADGAPSVAEPTPQASASPSPAPTQAPSPTPAPGTTPASTSAAEATPAAPPVATPSPQPTQAAIPVAGRAAMLVADGADTQKPTVSVGSVVWSPAPAIPGQPGSVGVKAEIDIPDLRMHASMVLRKNVDPGLPASHTIDFRVTFDPGSPIKGVKDIALPLMRRDDPPAADALVGVRVKINDGYYLVGLNRADADVAKNVDEIGTRGWFDFPMQLSDDRIAKLTFEKAADGDRVVADALAAWK